MPPEQQPGNPIKSCYLFVAPILTRPASTTLAWPPPAPAVISDDNFINSQNMDEEIFSSRLQMAELLLVAGGVFVVSTDVEK